MPWRRPASGCEGASENVTGSFGSAPCNSASVMAQSSTQRASGPGVSSVGLSGITPWALMRPMVVFRPVIPHQDAGIRTEPPVSVPMANGTMRDATATADPEDEPPGVRATAMSQGLTGVPICSLVPQAP